MFCVSALFYIEVPELPWKLMTAPTPTLSQILVIGPPPLNLREEEREAEPQTGRTGGEVKVMVTGEMAKGGGRKAEKEKCHTCTF